MKFMAFILSITIMALSIMPCRDINATPVNQALTIRQGTGAEESAGHGDHCSPFCLCSCCARILTAEITTASSMLTKPVSIVLKKQYYLLKISFASNFYGNIWQPPKLHGRA